MAPSNRPSNRPPAPRRKIGLACNPCREKKSRCDGAMPICSSCQRRKISIYQCIYQADNTRTASTNEYIATSHDRIRELEQAAARSPTTSSNIAPQTSNDDPNQAPRIVISNTQSDQLPELRSRPSANTSAPHSTEVDRSATQGWVGQMGQLTGMGEIATEIDQEATQDHAGDFFGPSSAASLMHLARKSMRPESGSKPNTQESSPFNVAASRPQIRVPISKQSWVDLPLQPRASVTYWLPPRHLADKLLQIYWDRVYYLYPFVHRPTFQKAYQSLWAPDGPSHYAANVVDVGLGSTPAAGPNSMPFHCALNVMFALGARFLVSEGPEMQSLANDLFLRAKKYIGLDFLDANNMGVVQSLLICAQFLQSTSHPNRCWNAVGVACRVAQGLGLHVDQPSASLESAEVEMRRRIWHGCVWMDMIVSLMFGRPPMTSHLTDVPLPSPSEDACGSSSDSCNMDKDNSPPSKLHFYVEALKLSRILGKILTSVYQPWLTSKRPHTAIERVRRQASVDEIVHLETELVAFESALPPFLRWHLSEQTDFASFHDDRLISMQRNVLHGRFTNMKMMLYRPSFTAVYQDWVCCAIGDSGPRPLSSESLGASNIYSSLRIQCARNCVMAAIEQQKLVFETFTTEETGAWWYNAHYSCVAGIITILAQSCPLLMEHLDSSHIESSVSHCEEVLGKLASLSKLAHVSLAMIRRFRSQNGQQESSERGEGIISRSLLVPRLESNHNGFASEVESWTPQFSRPIRTQAPDTSFQFNPEDDSAKEMRDLIDEDPFSSYDLAFDFMQDDFGLGSIDFSDTADYPVSFG